MMMLPLPAPYRNRGSQHTMFPLHSMRPEKIQPDAANLIGRFVQRVELRQDGIRLTLSLAPLVVTEVDSGGLTITRDIPMRMKRRGMEMRPIIAGNGPVRVGQTLLRTIIRTHKWFNDLVSGRVHNMAEIASREGVDKSVDFPGNKSGFSRPRHYGEYHRGAAACSSQR